MKKFIIERNLPGAGNLSPQELQAIARASCDIVCSIGKPYHWIQSFVTEDKIFSILIAPDEATVREYSHLTNLPADHIRLVKLVADITTGEQP